MKTTTQTQALAELERIGQQISGLLDRYASAGNGLVRRAEIGEALAQAFTERAEVYRNIPALFRGRNPQRPAAQLVTRMALESAALALTDAKTWSSAAQSARAEAQRIEEQAGAVFADDGMEYVPGRGWVRKSAASARMTLAELKQREEMQAKARRDDTRRYGLPATSDYVNWMSGGGDPEDGS